MKEDLWVFHYSVKGVQTFDFNLKKKKKVPLFSKPIHITLILHKSQATKIYEFERFGSSFELLRKYYECQLPNLIVVHLQHL